jgi:hypothetical protein
MARTRKNETEELGETGMLNERKKGKVEYLQEMKEESKSSRQMIYDIQRPLSDANGIGTCPSFYFFRFSFSIESHVFNSSVSFGK